MKKIIIPSLIILILAAGAFWYWQKTKPKLDPNSPSTYYKIFDHKEFLAGNEDKAKLVDAKLDQRLAEYKSIFSKMAGINDEEKLRAVFYMNFVQMYGYYYMRDLPERKTFRHLLWNTDANNCASNTMILAMLLDRAGYEYRTVSINGLSHGYIEVKFSDGWQILDPTTNLWITKSTEELMRGEPGQVKKFFVKAEDVNNEKAQKHLARGLNVLALRDNMAKIGRGFEVKIDKYNYIDLSGYDY